MCRCKHRVGIGEHCFAEFDRVRCRRKSRYGYLAKIGRKYEYIVPNDRDWALSRSARRAVLNDWSAATDEMEAVRQGIGLDTHRLRRGRNANSAVAVQILLEAWLQRLQRGARRRNRTNRVVDEIAVAV